MEGGDFPRLERTKEKNHQRLLSPLFLVSAVGFISSLPTEVISSASFLPSFLSSVNPLWLLPRDRREVMSFDLW